MKRNHSIGVTQSRAAYSMKVASSDLVIGLSMARISRRSVGRASSYRRRGRVAINLAAMQPPTCDCGARATHCGLFAPHPLARLVDGVTTSLSGRGGF